MPLTGKTIRQTTYTGIIAQSDGSNSSDGVSGTFPFFLVMDIVYNLTVPTKEYKKF